MRLLGLGLVVLPLCACVSQQELAVETGVPRGSLAVAAIDRGDMARAEQLLRASVLDSDDPARLINLGYVQMTQGRRAEAIATWQAALDAPRHRWIQTVSGREVRTDDLAREVIARYRPTVASR